MLRLFRKSTRRRSTMHIKCRNNTYLGGPARFTVPNDKVSWETSWSEYNPVEYTAGVVKANPVWADDPDKLEDIKFNREDDAHMSRKSFIGKYAIDKKTHMPL
ncbi:hypothetical protein PTSG_03660 [Salpingoeca rosetta]|uniref:Uncharacterized protein n=1 Tax=Salpingoeca rosetta (strain ATCC 50818 / BSB-021) TaxID=946362 RepID=F2U683_SALR5|nr:uncharacterized protein PTSG_03660 [Salpingoeca rosetta]EGD83024.1 hypothetical protein PTSG_03660 [Salpingoeca rosetta]|eukprot:XP_004995388.1 hypothetical protein PTSG_03660 [Salpingoeca rosetta]